MNGLLIQWGSVTASISKTDYKKFPTSFSSENSWFAATQSNQSETSLALGKMLKGTSGANFLPWARSGSNNYSDTFEYIAIGYQLNGLLIQWGIELVDKNKRYNDITYYAYSLPPIVLLSATRSATRWESAGFVGAINITKNGFRASYGEYNVETNIEKYTWLAIGESA